MGSCSGGKRTGSPPFHPPIQPTQHFLEVALRQGAVLKAQRPSARRLGGWEGGCEKGKIIMQVGAEVSGQERTAALLQPHSQPGLPHNLSTHVCTCACTLTPTFSGSAEMQL